MQDSAFVVQVAQNAHYWLHRAVGKKEFTQYTLPCGQLPRLSSGEVVGPLSARGVRKFFEDLVEEQQEQKKLKST